MPIPGCQRRGQLTSTEKFTCLAYAWVVVNLLPVLTPSKERSANSEHSTERQIASRATDELTASLNLDVFHTDGLSVFGKRGFQGYLCCPCYSDGGESLLVVSIAVIIVSIRVEVKRMRMIRFCQFFTEESTI